MSETQAALDAKKTSLDAEARNAELVKKVEDAEQKVNQLQESVQRYANPF